ncbi:MAG: TonB-dependent receptor [Leadbetterella sp.]|nr:TonB-dependent receptor [Leadbetterella sp.]
MAQGDPVTLHLSSARFSELIRSLENQTPYKFYYLPAETDSLLITWSGSNKALNQALTEILHPLNFRFAVDPRKKIYITREAFILTEFRDIHASKPGPPATTPDVVIRDFLEAQPEDISIENKVFEIGSKDQPVKGEKTLSGYIRSKNTGAPVSGATVSVQGRPSAVQTDLHGYYSIIVPQERSVLLISSVGLRDTRRQLVMYGSGRLDIEMTDQVFSLNEVVVAGERGNQVKRMQMGLEKLNIKTIKQTPAVFGEADVISVILTLPGVQTVGEAANGFNVRGGATDQNLVLFNDATIFNPSHFFGLFSSFNPDAVNQLELYKSSIPARFGGRLSSVLDVAGKEGNRNKLSGAGGIGLLTGRVSLDGPIGKKTQFLAGPQYVFRLAAEGHTGRLLPQQQRVIL